MVIVHIILLILVILTFTEKFYDLHREYDDNDSQQFWECGLMSWLTLSGLGWSRKDAVYRLLSSLTVTILYSLILVICNVSPESGNLLLVGLSWSELELVKYPFSRKTAITPMFFEQIEKFQCLLQSTGQGPSHGILRIHVGTCHVSQNVSESWSTLLCNISKNPTCLI